VLWYKRALEVGDSDAHAPEADVIRLAKTVPTEYVCDDARIDLRLRKRTSLIICARLPTMAFEASTDHRGRLDGLKGMIAQMWRTFWRDKPKGAAVYFGQTNPRWSVNILAKRTQRRRPNLAERTQRCRRIFWPNEPGVVVEQVSRAAIDFSNCTSK
jgi:hypothetical protein